MTYLPVILLTLAMIVGIPIAYRTWREAHEEDDPVTEDDVLADIEQAFLDGELDEAEFRRARALILGIEPPADSDPSEAPSRGEPT